MERLVNRKAGNFLRKYKLRNFYYVDIVKTNYFNDRYRMDWLVGEWILATNIKNLKEDDDRFVTMRVFSGINFRDERYQTTEMIEKVKKIVSLHWPFYIFNNGKKINFLPLFDTYGSLRKFTTEENFEKYFKELIIKAINEIYYIQPDFLNILNTETFKNSKNNFLNEEWYLSSDELRIDESKNYLFDFEGQIKKSKIKKSKRSF